MMSFLRKNSRRWGLILGLSWGCSGGGGGGRGCPIRCSFRGRCRRALATTVPFSRRWQVLLAKGPAEGAVDEGQYEADGGDSAEQRQQIDRRGADLHQDVGERELQKRDRAPQVAQLPA